MTSRRTSQKSSAAPHVQPDGGGFSLISNEKLIAIYTALVKCRMLAQRIVRVPRRGKGPGPAPELDREATLASVVVDLLPEDALSLSHADLVAGYIKGMPLHELIRSLAPAGHGSVRLRSRATRKEAMQGHVIPPAPSTAAQLHIACGVACALKVQNACNITVALCDEFAAAQDAWREALTFAAMHQLPILFVCQQSIRNQAEELATQAQFDAMAAHAHVHRIPALTVDGHDAVAVYRVAFESIARARQGRGPTLIECRNHGGIFARKSKPMGVKDPLRRMEAYLMHKGLLSPGLKRKIAASVRSELDAALSSGTKPA